MRRLLRHHQSHRTPGQALVEFALAATLIFFLLAAAVDLGLIYFNLQALRSAAQEGAVFGSRPIYIDTDGDGQIEVRLNYDEIRNRVRNEAGTMGGFVNLRDLNQNGTLDVNESAAVQEDLIRIELFRDANGDSRLPDPDGADFHRCQDDDIFMRTAGMRCYIRVTVTTTYRPVFPFAPALADEVPLRASIFYRIRSEFQG